MNEEEQREWAVKIATEELGNLDYLYVYENSDLVSALDDAGLDDDDIDEVVENIHSIITKNLKVSYNG